MDGVSRPASDEAARLVAEFGSPLYVYDAQAVELAYGRFRSAFTYEPTECHYAIVCNHNRYLVRLLYGLGAGIHANTPGDAYAALAAGVPASRVVYSGTNLSAADLDYLIDLGVRLNLDSIDQLRDLARRGGANQVGLRLLVDDPGIANRIGVAPDELDEAVAVAEAGGLRITGLHMYAGTNTRSVKRFLTCLDRLVAASGALDGLEELDVGGGFGLAYRPGQLPLDLDALGREVSLRMDRLSRCRRRAIRLVLEPGRILVGASGTLLVTVVSVKERGGRRFVGVDSTVGNLVVPSVYHAYHRVDALVVDSEALDIPTDLCGNTTHSRDFLGRDLRLPHLQPGDLLAVRDVGAYGYVMSSHFLNRPRPPEVVLDGNEVHLTTRRETLDDILAAQLR